MARNYILGGMAATQLQAGKPYFKRIIRIGGNGAIDRTFQEGTPGRDGLTCEIITAPGANQGAIPFDGVNSSHWNANADGAGGEL